MFQPNQKYSPIPIRIAFALSLLFILVSFTLKAQIKNDSTIVSDLVSASDSSKRFINTTNDSISSVIERVNAAKHTVNDSLNQIKNIVAKKSGIESINNKLIPFQKIAPQTNTMLPDNIMKGSNLEIPSFQAPAISKVNLGIKDKFKGQIPAKRKWLRVPLGRVKSIKQAIDTGNYEIVEKIAEEKIAEEFEELNTLQSAKSDLPMADIDKLQEIDWDPQKLADSKKVSELMAKNADKLQGAFNQVDQLKKKYSKVNLLNANGPVMEPISNKPVKRWVYGLGFQGNWQNQLNLSVAPIIGYRINKKWTAGVSGVMQLSINVKDSFSIQSKQDFAYRIYSQYVFYKNIFVHAEFEQPYGVKSEELRKNWYDVNRKQARGWLGLGIEYKIYKKLKGQTQVLYNIVPPDYTKPFESRWGIRVNLIY
jgi:hypothetical protein